ncbi:hypothetical protein [Nocardia gipuzkoensis]|uniref:hypothetical protein n=1 Tax=Nocardia gipuzkoensis TaxID=2749991 RepID=UPI00237DC4B1|nr:hypothetical protein [Nocardia gipuzkoensis]MDE1670976.1 hypothetical protein [Nocardia gipuzkoensis]
MDRSASAAAQPVGPAVGLPVVPGARDVQQQLRVQQAGHDHVGTVARPLQPGGHTAKLVLAELRRRGVDPVRVSRDFDRLRAAAAETGLPDTAVRVAGLATPHSRRGRPRTRCGGRGSSEPPSTPRPGRAWTAVQGELDLQQ